MPMMRRVGATIKSVKEVKVASFMCVKCGNIISKDLERCPHCGAIIAGKEELSSNIKTNS